MSESDKARQGSEPWKQKYYDTLQQLEAKERRWVDLEALLRRAIARLSLVADGQDPVLDPHLAALREAVRSDDDTRLNDALEGLSKALMQQEGQGTDAAGPNDGAVAGEKPAGDGRGILAGLFSRRTDQAILMQLLDGLIVPHSLQDDLGALRRRVAAMTDQAEQQRVVQELLELFNGLLAQDQGLSGSGTQPCTSAVLLRLLDNLSVPPESSNHLNSVRARLEAGVAPAQWGEVLDELARLLAGMRASIEHEKDELEAFLGQLTERLHDLEQHLVGADSAREAVITSGRQLNAAVQDHVRSIETSVQEAANISQVKYTIQTRLEAIRTNMEAHRRAEEQRNAELEKRLKELNDRLFSMERETEQLRTRLKEEREQALTDPLTGVHNRLAYDERIALEFARWKRTRAPLTLLVWDVDRFKLINDNYGHKAGDKVLKTIAQLLAKQVRETDFVARYGGEEFVMLLINTAAAAALNVADKLRKSIEACGFHYSGQAVPVTISCGLADFREGDTPEKVFERADAALYKAKQGGRNNCQL